MDLSARRACIVALATIMGLSAALPWDGHVTMFTVIGGGAAFAAGAVDRRNRWPWALALACVVTVTVTALAADGISTRDANGGAFLGTSVVMCAGLVVLAIVGAVRALITPDAARGWTQSSQAQIVVVGACAVKVMVTPHSTVFVYVGLLSAAAAVATAWQRDRRPWPWLISVAAFAAALAAGYPAESDYSDRTAPLAPLQDSSVPEIVIIGAGAVALATALWALRATSSRSRAPALYSDDVTRGMSRSG